MGEKITEQQSARLQILIGKEICTYGTCAAEDESGVAHNMEIARYEGVLRDVDYDRERRELDSITIETERGPIKLDFNTPTGRSVFDIRRGIYHRGEEILEVNGWAGGISPSLSDPRYSH